MADRNRTIDVDVLDTLPQGQGEAAATADGKRVKLILLAIGFPSGRWCTMRDEFASYSFLAVTVGGLVLLCSGLLAIAFT
jgi:hypothetical protein